MKVTKGIVSLLSKRKVELVRTQTDTYHLTDGLMFLGAYQSAQTIIVAKSLTSNCWHSSISLLLYLPGELRVADITHNISAHRAHLFPCILPSGPRIGSLSRVQKSLPLLTWFSNSLQSSFGVGKENKQIYLSFSSFLFWHFE